jgi:hypothetical protein
MTADDDPLNELLPAPQPRRVARPRPPTGQQRSGRWTGWIPLVDEVRDRCGPTGVDTWTALGNHRQQRDGSLTIGHDELARLLGVGRDAAKRRMRSLRKAGLIRQRTRGQRTARHAFVSTYHLRESPAFTGARTPP